jgi:basic membrane protein A
MNGRGKIIPVRFTFDSVIQLIFFLSRKCGRKREIRNGSDPIWEGDVKMAAIAILSRNASIGLVLLNIFLLCSCGPGTEAPNCGSADILCVGLVTDVGSIDDRSFNQSSWAGVQQAVAELGAHGNYIETKDAKDYMANIELFVNQAYDVIVTVGFGLAEATGQAASKYPQIKFIGVDQYQVQSIPNVTGLIFHEDRAGFMAGALAAMISQTGIIAAVLGTDLVPPVVAFRKGYEAGARYIKSDLQIISTFHPGGLDVAFTDPEWGASTAKQAIDQGADVVFAAGGTTGNGGLIEVASHPNKFCIGVDTDQWETLPEARPCLISSAMKLIAPGVFDLIEKAAANRFPSGNFYGDVGLAPLHEFETKISSEIKDRLAHIDQQLRAGSIIPTR